MPSSVRHDSLVGAPLHYDVFTTSLDNGLHLAINHDPDAPGVAVNIWFDVGSADEKKGTSGFAHLFEHLMFAGSANVEAGEHLAAIQAIGGTVNATTSFDRTNYFETVTSGAVDLALWLEADRLSTLEVTQSNLDTQRDVVKEEKRQCYDNVPYGDQLELMLALNFPSEHPYSTPVIGSIPDLDRATLHDVQDFFSSWYHPANAYVTLAGNISPDHGVELVERYMGHIPAGMMPARSHPDPLAPHTDIPSLTVTRDVPRPMVHLSWRSAPLSHPDDLAIMIALEILAGGLTSPLYQELVRERELVEGIDAYDLGLARQTSLAVISAHVKPGVSSERVINAIIPHISRLASAGPSETEMNQAMASLEKQWLLSLARIGERADYINHCAVHFEDPLQINRIVPALMSLTPDDVRRVVATWLADDAFAVLSYEMSSS